MQIERSCIHPFIEQTQKAFKEEGSLSDALGTIRDYQNRVNNLVTHISPEAKIPHAIGMSLVGLGTVVVWEYARSKGIPLPDTRDIVGLVPVASMTVDDGMTDAERKWARQLRDSRDDSPENRQCDDAHRAHAHGRIDQKLEAGEISSREAQSYKSDWNKRHGY